jgi:hypothetical protein
VAIFVGLNGCGPPPIRMTAMAAPCAQPEAATVGRMVDEFPLTPATDPVWTMGDAQASSGRPEYKWRMRAMLPVRISRPPRRDGQRTAWTRFLRGEPASGVEVHGPAVIEPLWVGFTRATEPTRPKAKLVGYCQSQAVAVNDCDSLTQGSAGLPRAAAGPVGVLHLGSELPIGQPLPKHPLVPYALKVRRSNLVSRDAWHDD